MDFYRLEKDENERYCYEGKLISSKMINLSDPTYDLTFKGLFSQSACSEAAWKKRTINFLESLIFDDKIENIENLDKEYIQHNFVSNKNNEFLNNMMSDLSFKLKTKNGKDIQIINLINIEMQLGYPKNFLEKLFHYGILLKNNNLSKDKEFKTIVVGFINYKGNLDKLNFETNSYYLSEFSSQTDEFIQKIDDFIDIVIINLQNVSNKLLKNEPIYIFGKEIGSMGKNWLKLLCLRHWAIKNKNEKNRYEIPNLDFKSEINSAISYLKGVTNKSLKQFYTEEDFYLNSIKDAAEVLAEEKAKVLAEEKAKVLAEEKAKVLAEKKAEVLAEKKAEVLAEKKAEILAAKKNEDSNIKIFLKIYKYLKDFDLEDYEKTNNFDFSVVDPNKIELFWGNDDKNKDKLEKLKTYIGKKRNKTIEKKNK